MKLDCAALAGALCRFGSHSVQHIGVRRRLLAPSAGEEPILTQLYSNRPGA